MKKICLIILCLIGFTFAADDWIPKFEKRYEAMKKRNEKSLATYQKNLDREKKPELKILRTEQVAIYKQIIEETEVFKKYIDKKERSKTDRQSYYITILQSKASTINLIMNTYYPARYYTSQQKAKKVKAEKILSEIVLVQDNLKEINIQLDTLLEEIKKTIK